MAVNILVETYRQEGSLDIDFHCAEPESMKRIDHANASDRKWLATHCFWAMRNHRVVISTPLAPLAD